MVAIKINKFGGMIPAIDGRLLPDNQAQYAQNIRVLTGSVEPLRVPRLIYTPKSPSTRRVYRIPRANFTKEYIDASYWLEFDNQDVDVIHSPTVQDEFDRYYWASTQRYGPQPPQYNTLERIIAEDPPLLLGVPTPPVAPTVSRTAGVVYLESPTSEMAILMGSVQSYKVFGFGVDTKTRSVGPNVDKVYEEWGRSLLRSNTRGQLGKAESQTNASKAANEIEITGFPAEIRYYTANVNKRVVVDNQGRVTSGLPTPPDPANARGFYKGVGLQEARAYVYTWITAFGEESAPSPATLYNGYSGDEWAITLKAPGTEITDKRLIEKTRIYRTVSGVGGSTTYFFVADVPVAQLIYLDKIEDTVVSAGAILQSYLWTPPPEDLEGMALMPNGIICGWRKNEVWFCEPYRPHAWPTSYTVSVEYPIIGIGVIGQSAIICTTGNPYTISGINPASMAVSRIASYEPCLSRGSIISGQSGVLYASPNGLALAIPGQVTVVTENLINHDQWLDYGNYLQLSTLRAATFSGGYYCWSTTQLGCFLDAAFDNDAFEVSDFTGAKKGAIIDLKDPRSGYSFLSSKKPVVGVFNDHWTGEVFFLSDNKVYWVDTSSAQEFSQFVWRSKVFEMPNQRNMEAMRVHFIPLATVTDYGPGPFGGGYWDDREIWDDTELYNFLWLDEGDDGDIGEQDQLVVKVFADGRLVYRKSLSETGQLLRLPSGFKAMFWQVELKGRVTLKSFEMATSAKELINV
jgi:hypothetical protein